MNEETLEKVQEEKHAEESAKEESPQPDVNIPLTDEQKVELQKFIDQEFGLAMMEVKPIDLSSVFNKKNVTKKDITEYRKKWTQVYLETLVKMCVILPETIQTNQEILTEIMNQLTKTPDDENLKSMRLDTIQMILSAKGDIQNRERLLSQYDHIFELLDSIL